MKLNLTTKLVAYFLLVVLVAALGFVYAIYKVNDVARITANINDDVLPRLLKTNEAKNNASGEVSNLRGYFITKEKRLLDDHKNRANKNRTMVEELISNSVTPEEKRLATDAKALEEKYLEIADKRYIPLIQAGKMDEAAVVMTSEMGEAAKSMNYKFMEFQAFRSKQITDSLAQATDNANAARRAVILTALLAAVAGILIGFFAARSIARPVNQLAVAARKVAGGDLTEQVRVDSQDEIGQLAAAFNTMVTQLTSLIRQINAGAEQVAASSEELTASSEQSAQTANQIAASTTGMATGATEQVTAAAETMAVVEHLSAGIQQVAANASQVSEQSAQAAGKAREGDKAVEKAVRQMAQIEETVNTSATVVVKLGERSKEIGQIVDTISGIAGQTNLLALNAAIEAARAGEQGRGFAVVAEEVRKLAEQSQEAAKKIADLIGEIQGDTDQAVVAMSDGTREVKTGAEVVGAAGATFRVIVELISEVSGQVREISAAMQQMADGSQQIVGSVKKIDSLSKASAGEAQSVSAATEEQLASMEEIAGSSQALAKLAQDLQTAAAKFRV